MKEIPVLFENNDCIIFNKPAGLAVQGGAGIKISLDSILAERFEGRPLLVHRLDRDTSGIILVARHKEAAAFFSRLFSREGEGEGGGPGGTSAGGRKITKQYLALCSGVPAEPEGCITMDISVKGESKKAGTLYKCLKSYPQSEDNEFSLLEMTLLTGRMHQIRRHLSQSGHPILGDDKYGDFALNKRLRKSLGLKHLHLHSSRLCIPNILDVTAPLPEYWLFY
ncbi:hypothetical protein AGMMS49928_08150 [Spirochaetia bacterium]|nr:hypothetical protein AGMMS49928_08150 [Spirochaetia bacterium]